MLILVGVVAFITIVVVLIVANTMSSERQVKFALEHDHGLADPQMTRELNVVLARPILAGNRIEHLCNGDEIFPAMLAAISAARSTINFETYIYWSGDIAAQFSSSFAERARAGVTVNVLLDWVGSIGMEDELIQEMTAAGVNVQYYHPLRWYQTWRMNNRTHRKLLVIDGRVGFIGGVGIADEWLGDAGDENHWRDSHFRVSGPVVSQLQAAFLDGWLKTSGHMLRGPAYFPSLEPCGDADAQVLASSPTGGSESMHLLYHMNLAAAEHTIDLAAAYFVPDSLSLRILLDACGRGVRLRVLMPGRHTDSFMVHHASRSLWSPLLRAGAELYVFEPTMFHMKMLIVDELMTSVGSTNFDNRSFRLNNEASLNVHDRDFAALMTRVYERDLKRARRITLEQWERRPLTQRMIEHVFARVADQL